MIWRLPLQTRWIEFVARLQPSIFCSRVIIKCRFDLLLTSSVLFTRHLSKLQIPIVRNKSRLNMINVRLLSVSFVNKRNLALRMRTHWKRLFRNRQLNDSWHVFTLFPLAVFLCISTEFRYTKKSRGNRVEQMSIGLAIVQMTDARSKSLTQCVLIVWNIQ